MAVRPVHEPVLVKEVLELLESITDGIVLEMTVGAAGHSKAVLGRPGDRCRLFGIDRDPQVLRHATETLAPYADRVSLRCGSFDEADRLFPELEKEPPRAILFDLGVSSLQLDDPVRGFSFDHDGPLDMRMGPDSELTAAEIVNRWPVRELEDLFRRYGEEPRARRVAEAIVAARRTMPIRTTGTLATLVSRVATRRPGRHPATKCFMALRLAVNGELERLAKGLARALDMLAAGGRIIVIAFHSLEDREVKQQLRVAAAAGRLRVLTRKPIVAQPAERRENPRSRSARLRAAEVLGSSVTARDDKAV